MWKTVFWASNQLFRQLCIKKKKFRWVFFFPPSLQPTQPFTTSQLAREEAPLNSSRSAKHKLFIFPPRIVLTAPLNVLDGVEAVNVVKRDLLSPHFKKKKKLFFRPSCGGKGASQPGGVSAQIPYQSLHLWHSHGLIIKSAYVFWFCAFVYLFFFFFFLWTFLFLLNVYLYIYCPLLFGNDDDVAGPCLGSCKIAHGSTYASDVTPQIKYYIYIYI